MNRPLLLAAVALHCITLLSAITPPGGKAGPGVEITARKNATHIGRITGDTLVVIAGITYSFTVDTPEDQGLVSIKTDVAALLRQVGAQDGSIQKYQVISKDGVARNEGDILTGDRLVVTSR